MTFFSFAAESLTSIVLSLASNSLSNAIGSAQTERKMKRLVEDSIDHIVEQTEEYLKAENLSESKKRVLLSSISENLQLVADDPQKFFAGDLDGSRIFEQCHPDGDLPQEISEEKLDQFYSILFPRIAHFLAGSRIALAEWQAEGYRDGYKRLREMAEEIHNVSAKVSDVPMALMGALANEADQKAETLLRELTQTLLNKLLLRLDISPLRPERLLHGSLCEHFVIPALCERKEKAEVIGQEKLLLGELAKQGSRHVVFGGAGTGKTTWGLWMQSRLLQDNVGRLAIVLRLRKIKDIEKRSLLDILHKTAGVHLRDELTIEVLRIWYSTGRLVVILDGFDEIPEKRRKGVEKWIKELSSVANNSTIILTSRSLQSGHLNNMDRLWRKWDLLTFDKPRIIEFIERWHCHLPEGELSDSERKVDAPLLANTFYSDPSLKALADTPLMLGTLLFVHHRDNKLPSGRVDLYERYIAAMLGLRDSGLGIEARATKLTDKQKRKVLSHIALHFHIEQVNEVDDDVMYHLVSEALIKFEFNEDVDQLLPALCERTGLLQGPGAWSFMHKTISEFFVAELICDGITILPNCSRLDRKELWRHWNEDLWTSVLFFWAGRTSAKELEEFIRDLLKENNSDAQFLALSLINDQGYRLDFKMQREMILLLIRELRYEVESREGVLGICATPIHIPSRFAPPGFSAHSIFLRGLANVDCIDVFTKLFKQSLLKLEDISICHSSCIEILSLSAIWSISDRFSQQELNKLADLNSITRQDLALYIFRNTFPTGGEAKDSLELWNNWLVKWEGLFPEAGEILPILLVGNILEFAIPRADDDRFQFMWLLLWERRKQEVNEVWLKESVVCNMHNLTHELKVLKNKDSLKRVRMMLLSPDKFCPKLEPEKCMALIEWCDHQIVRRTELLNDKTDN